VPLTSTTQRRESASTIALRERLKASQNNPSHIKRLFEKTGVSSRQELVARIFLDDYMPLVAGGAPLSSTGGFAA
jgi:hypothetical protein